VDAVKAIAVALLGLGLAGCAPATHPQAKGPAVPVSPWHDGAEDVAAIGGVAAERLAEVSTLLESTASPATPAEPGAEGAPGPFEPEVVHRARIAMAREALVEDNLNKARVDLAEELQRELAALQESSGTSKSRVKRGQPTKKQP
jgi:hypothetical protein